MTRPEKIHEGFCFLKRNIEQKPAGFACLKIWRINIPKMTTL